MSLKMTNSPLSVCRILVGFSPIEIIGDKYIPEIQDRFRKEKMPSYKKSTVPVPPMYGDQAQEITEEERWHFFDNKGTELVTITKNSFDYSVFSYQNFESFKSRFFKLLGIFSEVADFYTSSVVSFFSLRYVNAIEGSDWKSYVSESYRGIELPESITHKAEFVNHGSFLQTPTNLGDLGSGTMIVKLLQNNQGIRIPLDIFSVHPIETQENRKITLLDLDHFVILDSEYVEQSFLETISEVLHETIKEVFLAALSDRAKEEWK